MRELAACQVALVLVVLLVAAVEEETSITSSVVVHPVVVEGSLSATPKAFSQSSFEAKLVSTAVEAVLMTLRIFSLVSHQDKVLGNPVADQDNQDSVPSQL